MLHYAQIKGRVSSNVQNTRDMVFVCEIIVNHNFVAFKGSYVKLCLTT